MVSQKLKKLTSVWILAVLALFILSIILGITMRVFQGNAIPQSSITFYGLMTTHGLTMIGIWFVAGMAALNYIMQRYVKAPEGVNLFALVMTVIGVVMLWVSTFVGEFHTGWTFLYPLPLYMAWAGWATPLFLVSLTVLGVGWVVWSLGILIEIFKKYPLTKALAWQHFSKDPDTETPPFILISVVTLIGVISCLIAAVILLVLFYVEYFSGGDFVNDALLMKNLTYFFGHTLANEMLYLGLAVLYELFPEISGRPKWKTTWYVALAWNCTLVFILTAFFHHLYMDFVQPEALQIIGQLASYMASLPAVAVTVFSVLALVFRNPVKWSLTNTLFFFGVAGWVVGGLAAVIDATIANNFVLHNTLWVPAHFHTYNALGNVLFSLAFFHWVTQDFVSSESGNTLFEKFGIKLLGIGGVGFLLMFYIAGARSVPRRFDLYPDEFTMAPFLALLGAAFATIYLIAVFLFFKDILGKCIHVLKSS